MKLSDEDLKLVQAIPANACPRRYCYFWRSGDLRWDLPPSEGCTFLEDKIPSYKYSGVPCCRADVSSAVDHFEPIEPIAEKDGIDYHKWVRAKALNDESLHKKDGAHASAAIPDKGMDRSMKTEANAVDTILTMFAFAGKAAYFGEAVSQTEHALQSAHLAASAGADAELVVAALLHDIGHLLSGLPEDVAQHGIDDTHEEAGARWLEQHFGSAVSAPVRLHVAAKRYLCAMDVTYIAGLSPASQLSLRLQGGPFTVDEARAFERQTHFAAAVALRRWDDGAKVAGLEVPTLATYRHALETALQRGGKTS